MMSRKNIERTQPAEALAGHELDSVVAEWAGWRLGRGVGGTLEWQTPYGDRSPHGPPEFSTSMHAAAELRKAIRDCGPQAEARFALALRDRMINEFWETGPGPTLPPNERIAFQMVDSSPRQQADAAYEAFIRGR